MQIKTVKQVARVAAGYTFRKAIKGSPDGQSRVIMAKNINEHGAINYEDLTNISDIPNRSNALVENGDVLLSSRGVFRAGVFWDKMESVVAASSTFILRVKNTEVVPEYVAIYLNSEAGQAGIQKILTGSTIKTILRKSLENLKIPIPALSIQKQIINISQNIQKREALLNKKINLSKNIAEGAIKKLLTI